MDERFSAWKGVPLLHRWRGGWWRWQTSHYAEMEQAEARAEVYDFTRDAVYAADGGFEPWAPNRYKVSDVLDALAGITQLNSTKNPPVWLDDADEDLINNSPSANEIVSVANGLLDVPTRELFPHNPWFLNLVSVPFAYDPDAPPPEAWLAFLKSLWPDDPQSIAVLQEWFGYLVSGRTDLHKILLLVGPTRSGKGTIGRIMKEIVGRANTAGPTLASLGQHFGLQPLLGRSLALVSDARLGGSNAHVVVERLLSISGEDPLSINRKYKGATEQTLPCRFVVLSNELPAFGDASGAVAARFVVLVMTTSWLGREDLGLTARLLTELPSILLWALDGLTRLQEHGHFTEPTSSRDAVIALQDLTSPTAAFVRDECTVGSGEVDCATLYVAWKAWALVNGHRTGSAQTFGRDLRAVAPGLRVVRPRTGEDARSRRYQGISLRPHDGPVRSGPMDQPFLSEESG